MKKENNDCLGVQKTGVTGVQTNDFLANGLSSELQSEAKTPKLPNTPSSIEVYGAREKRWQ